MAAEPAAAAAQPQSAVPRAPPPEHCPGTESETAGKAEACAGCPNQGICAANAAAGPRGPDPDLAVVRQRLELVRHKLLVLSGKGGVGKSTFSAQLAFAFARGEETEVGVLDIDICGPSIPKIMGVEGETIHQSTTGWQPVSVQENLVAMSIGFMLPNSDDAVIWRGPKKNGLIKQFLKDVEWGSLDYLIVDTPPGTTDEHLSVVQYLKDSSIEGAVLITSPQEVALQDVRKEIDFCRKVKLKIIGVVENMSGWECLKCHKISNVFPSTTGGAKQMCQELDVPFLGSIPLDPRLGMSCDRGISFLDEYPDSPTTAAYLRIVGAIRDSLSACR